MNTTTRSVGSDSIALFEQSGPARRLPLYRRMLRNAISTPANSKVERARAGAGLARNLRSADASYRDARTVMTRFHEIATLDSAWIDDDPYTLDEVIVSLDREFGLVVPSREVPRRDRPEIVVSGGSLMEREEKALEALRLVNEPPRLFLHDERIVRVIHRRGELPRAEPISKRALGKELSKAAYWVETPSTVDADGIFKPGKSAAPDRFVLRNLLPRGAVTDFLVLRGFEQVPFVRPDGSVVEQEGFDWASGYYLWNPPACDTDFVFDTRSSVVVPMTTEIQLNRRLARLRTAGSHLRQRGEKHEEH